MTFDAVVTARFPGAVPVHEFVASSLADLAARGFRPGNTLPCVGVCRDEICAPFVDALQATWGPYFSFASLAGAVIPGRTAFGAFLHHAPVEGERQRIVLFGFTHVAIDADGVIGPCSRPGLPGASSACGALVGFHGELGGGLGDLSIPEDDAEYGLLRQRLASRLEPGTTLDLADVTMLAHRVLAEDLAAVVLGNMDPERVDAAVYTGVQVHGPAGLELVWIGDAWTRTQDGRVALR